MPGTVTDTNPTEAASRVFPKFKSYGMLATAASVGWKVKDAIVEFHRIGRLVAPVNPLLLGVTIRFYQ